MSDNTSHKLDRQLSELVKKTARSRPGNDWGAVKRANHEMAFIWLSLQSPVVMADVYGADDVPFDSLEDVRSYLYGDLFDGDDDFAPNGLLNAFAQDAIDSALDRAQAEQRTVREVGELLDSEAVEDRPRRRSRRDA